ncbi:MAG: asparagine synthase (glutamine-hydrolyzing) [bacterium]
MCGICGIAPGADTNVIRSMCATLLHRGPDDEGYYDDPGVSLGMRRLAIIDLRTGRQPIFNESRSLCIVFNGEIYNYRELRAGLESRGHVFTTASDTETILHLFEEEGANCVHKLLGMFAFAVWNSQKRELFVARDRLGVKPLYYHHSNGRLVFASEIKALLASGVVERKIHLPALHHYLSLMYVPGPQTIFEGVRRLPPGHTMTFRDGRLTLERYWRITRETGAPLIRDTALLRREIRDRLREAVACRLISDVPLGAFLSGGVDSSAVVAFMSESSPAPPKTFSIGFSGAAERGFDELRFAAAVARRFNTDHHEFRVNVNDLLNVLPSLIWHADQPNVTCFPNHLVAAITSRHVRVALAGIGGDELFGGYRRYLAEKLLPLYTAVPAPVRKLLIEKLVALAPQAREIEGRFLSNWARRFVSGAALPPPQRYFNWFARFSEDAKRQLYSDVLNAETAGADASLLFAALFDEFNAPEPLDNIFFADLNTYLVDDLLEHADKIGMAHSIEIRVPFCDHRLVEFSRSIPNNLKIRNLSTKYIFKLAMKNVLPDEILFRKKHGFMLPLGLWLKNRLNDHLRDCLSPGVLAERGFFKPASVQRMIKLHRDGKRNFSEQLFLLLVFEMWHRIFVDPPQIPNLNVRDAMSRLA